MQCQGSDKTGSIVCKSLVLLGNNLTSVLKFLDLVILLLRIYFKEIIQNMGKVLCINMLTFIYNMKSWDQPKNPSWDAI